MFNSNKTFNADLIIAILLISAFPGSTSDFALSICFEMFGCDEVDANECPIISPDAPIGFFIPKPGLSFGLNVVPPLLPSKLRTAALVDCFCCFSY